MTHILGLKCECCDDRCVAHKGKDRCHNDATYLLYRVDMQDRTGTAMCEECSDDAFSSGLYTTRDEEE